MPTLRIAGGGRLGNFIIMMLNAIAVAHVEGFNHITFMPRSFLTGTSIAITTLQRPLAPSDDTRGMWKHPSIPVMSEEQKRQWALQYIRPLLKHQLPSSHRLAALRHRSALCIYIRSGDIFAAHPHPLYVQPPLWFYEQIIVSQRWRRLYLVTEDAANPVVGALLAKYPRLHWFQQSLEKDLGMLLTARNLVGAFGTFLTAVLQMRDDPPEKFWAADYHTEKFPLRVVYPQVSRIIACPGYLKVGQWRNNDEGRRMMLTYRPIGTGNSAR
jgi:hypothetical protein